MREIEFQVNHNECGDCRVCCRVLPFTHDAQWADKYKEVNHWTSNENLIYRTGQACNKICSTGCSIQLNKPKICQNFWCDYLLYDLPEKYQPHKSGFVSYVAEAALTGTGEEELWIVLDELPDETGDYPNEGCKLLQEDGSFHYFKTLQDVMLPYGNEIRNFANIMREKLDRDITSKIMTRYEVAQV